MLSFLLTRRQNKKQTILENKLYPNFSIEIPLEAN